MDLTRSRKNRVKLTVEIPVEVVKRLKRAAREEERDVWRIVTRALRLYLEGAEKGNPEKGGRA